MITTLVSKECSFTICGLSISLASLSTQVMGTSASLSVYANTSNIPAFIILSRKKYHCSVKVQNQQDYKTKHPNLYNITWFIKTWQIGDTRYNLPHDCLNFPHNFFITFLPWHTDPIKYITQSITTLNKNEHKNESSKL